MGTLLNDLRYGLRMLAKSPGFALTAVITLALGIGANTAIFTLGNVFMFRPLAVKDADRLTVVAVKYHPDGDPDKLSYPDYQDYRKQQDVFTDMTFYDLNLVGLGFRGHADRVVMAYVPSSFFTMLGIRPALGRLIAPGEGDQPGTSEGQGAAPSWLTVVGVVGDAKVQGLMDAPSNFFYVPQAQNYKSTHVLQLRTSVPPERLIGPVEALVQKLDPNLPVYDVMTMEQALAGANGYFLFKVGASVAASLGLLGLLLALVGVYGVVSQAASQRRHEIGIRMALGAGRRNVLALVMGQAAVLVGAAVGVGALAALAVSRLLASLLVDLPFYDPLIFIGVSVLMLAVAMAACYLPARRAARVDPMVALRCE